MLSSISRGAVILVVVGGHGTEPGPVLVQRQGSVQELAVRGGGAGRQWARLMPSERGQVSV
jgi:hypothetical protein